MALGFLLAAEGVVWGHGGDPAPNLALSLSTHQSTGFIHNIYTPTETCAYHPEAGRLREDTAGRPRDAQRPLLAQYPGSGRGRTSQGCEAQVEIVERAVTA